MLALLDQPSVILVGGVNSPSGATGNDCPPSSVGASGPSSVEIAPTAMPLRAILASSGSSRSVLLLKWAFF